ncbi:MAG: ABC transporter transmembrane domain-containing protein [Pseudomonadota bacterium]
MPLAVIAIIQMLNATLSLLAIVAVQNLFDALTKTSNSSIENAITLLLLASITLILSSYLSSILRIVSHMRMGTRLASSLVDRVLSGGGKDMSTGEITSRMQDVSQLHAGITDALIRIITEALFLFIATLYAFYLNPYLTLLAWLGFPISFLIARWNGIMVNKPTQRIMEQQARYMNLLITAISNRAEANNIGSKLWFNTAISRRQKSLFRRQFSIQKLVTQFSTFGKLNTRLIEISTLIFGALFVLQDALTIGGLMAFYLILARLTNPLTMIAGLADDWKRVQIALSRVEPLLRAGESTKKWIKPVKLGILLSCRNLAVDRGTKPPLKVPNLSLSERELLWVNAPVGSGKTRLLQTIAGLERPSKGKIARSMNDCTIYLSSSSFLVKGSVRMNMLLGEKHTDEEIWATARRFGLDAVLSGLSDGLNTQVSSDGSGLSSGQQQTVGFLRAALRRPKLFLMDEATSNLEFETQNSVVAEFARKENKSAAIFVSHRKPPPNFKGIEYTISGDCLILHSKIG